MSTVTNQPGHTGPLRSARPRRRRRWGWQHLMVIGVAVLGACVLTYPSAASWFSDYSHATDADGYITKVQSLPSEQKTQLMNAANDYNKHLPTGPLRDPYVLDPNGQETAIGDGIEKYFTQLSTGTSDAMARVRIPTLKVDLPIFHGTDEHTLSRGVGHLYGSSLPVGGPSTHTVLTAHSGFVTATLFDNLHQLVKGDVVVLDVLDQTLYYKVDQILTVKPEETDALRQIPDKDYITLVTCTPTGVNTHRLLVRAERMPAPVGDEGTLLIPNQTSGPGLPWWVLVVITVSLGSYLLVRPAKSAATYTPVPAGKSPDPGSL